MQLRARELSLRPISIVDLEPLCTYGVFTQRGWQVPTREKPAEQVAEERQLRDTRLNLRVTSAQAAFIRRAAESSEKSST